MHCDPESRSRSPKLTLKCEAQTQRRQLQASSNLPRYFKLLKPTSGTKSEEKHPKNTNSTKTSKITFKETDKRKRRKKNLRIYQLIIMYYHRFASELKHHRQLD